ncbi:MAG: hypothetical protein ACP5D9_11950 [Mariniphaga sp.]
MKNSNQIIYQHEITPGKEEIRLYTNSRYPRWLDYARYHSSLAGIPDEAADVLNEVLLSLFSKEPQFQERLFKTKKGQYKELDFFVLRMIKLNAHSMTSPYRYKTRYAVPMVFNPNFSRINIEDIEDDQTDTAAETLRQYRLVRYVFSGLDLDEVERRIFEFRFIERNSFSEWPGPESRNKMYGTFYMVLDSIHEILYSHGLTKVKPKPSGYHYNKNRKAELIERFQNTRKIHNQKQLNNSL